MHHNIVIETHETKPGTFRADVVEGPDWARGWFAVADRRAGALNSLRQDFRNEGPSDSFDFIHAEM